MLIFSDDLKDENAQRYAESFWGRSFFWEEYDLERAQMEYDGEDDRPSAQIIPFPAASRKAVSQGAVNPAY
jgi:hypothetical protein